MVFYSSGSEQRRPCARVLGLPPALGAVRSLKDEPGETWQALRSPLRPLGGGDPWKRGSESQACL